MGWGATVLVGLSAMSPRALAAFESRAQRTASSERSLDLSVREENRYGLALGVLETYGTLASLSFHYNAFEFLQYTCSYGFVPSSILSFESEGDSLNSPKIWGFALRARAFVPDWKFTPYLGVGRTWWGASGEYDSKVGSLSISSWTTHFGFAWFTRMGFYLDLGVQLPVGPAHWKGTYEQDGVELSASASGGSGELIPLPSLALGWYF